MNWAHVLNMLSYLVEVLMWLVLGTAAGLAIGEGIGLVRRRRPPRARQTAKGRR